MVSKITNKIILAKINSLRDNDVKTTILREDGGFCSVKYIKDHEKAFRSLIPDYFDNFLKRLTGITKIGLLTEIFIWRTYVCN